MLSRPKARPPLRLIDCAKQRADRDRRETLAILRELLVLAAAGEIDGGGIACCFMTSSGRERFVLTGPYKANPALGVNAAERMKERCLAMQDELS